MLFFFMQPAIFSLYLIGRSLQTLSSAFTDMLDFIDDYCSDEPFEASAEEYPIKSKICLSIMIDQTVEILHSAQDEIEGYIETN